MNPILETIHKRASLRRYKEIPISSGDLETLLKAALRAPTAGNMMLYSVLVIEEQKTKGILSKTCDNQPFIARAPLVLVFLADYQRWFDYYRLAEVPSFCADRGLNWEEPGLGDLFIAVSDALIAAQTAVLAAESLGIGSCYIGDIMENYEIHRRLLQLPPYAFPIAMLCLGYYPDNYKPKFRERFSPEYLVYNEKYRRLGPSELEKMFFSWEQQFSPGNKFGAKNMGQFMYARKTGSDFAREMSRSVKAALQNWQDSGKGR
ncbi:MAG: nitroreductase [Firmicutes bacterium]|nr:nitroreductase [Bacillota bacterium]